MSNVKKKEDSDGPGTSILDVAQAASQPVAKPVVKSTAVPANATIDDSTLYEIDPEVVGQDVVVNVDVAPIMLPGEQANSTLRLCQGERISGKFYRELVTKHKISGLQLACKVGKPLLIKLEKDRKERLNEVVTPLVAECWALKETARK
jgi:hypothetical protein